VTRSSWSRRVRWASRLPPNYSSVSRTPKAPASPAATCRYLGASQPAPTTGSWEKEVGSLVEKSFMQVFTLNFHVAAVIQSRLEICRDRKHKIKCLLSTIFLTVYPCGRTQKGLASLPHEIPSPRLTHLPMQHPTLHPMFFPMPLPPPPCNPPPRLISCP
jgi:hypothetical protein